MTPPPEGDPVSDPAAAPVPAPHPGAALPRPARERWQPLRAGLVDLYHYDDQEFWFHDGRLLLRGNNGAGKSKVLALLLPFLLDGETGGHRLEPDGDAAKKMEWNLLLGGEHPNPERTGYSWLELGRRDADGVEHHATIGFGVKAVRGRGVVKRWFFTASARVGVDLRLLDGTRTVLTQERLDAALEGRGRVTTTAREHRAAVDGLFFGLGEQRYAALVDLLVQLRQPQLSRRPSESRLSDALTAALPPVDQAVLSDVAETFRSLEEDRTALERTREAHRGVQDFLGHYRGYARAAARRAARPPREAQSRHERTGRELAEARRVLEAAAQDVERAAEASAAASERGERAAARELALAGDPRMRSLGEVEASRRAAETAAHEVGSAEERVRVAHRSAERAGRRSSEAAAAARQGVREVTARGQGTDAEAAVAGVPLLGALASGAVEPLDVEAPPSDLGPWRRAGEAAGARRARELDRIDDLAREQEAAEVAAREALRAAEAAEAALARTVERCAGAERARTRAGDLLAGATTAWSVGLRELVLTDPAGVLADVESWLVAVDGPNPAETAAAAARDAAVAALTGERERSRAEAAVVAERVRDLIDELARLERGEHTPPASPPTRSAGSRTGAVGAPLWQVVELTTGSGDAEAAGLEAALEGAGLLDAWVGPRGLALADDVVLHPVPGDPALPAPGRSLADVLVASTTAALAARGVDDDLVTGVLRGIALGEPADGAPVVWVDERGRFGTPVSTGSWHRETSEHLGAGARERARAARIAAVGAELARLRQAELDLEDAVEALTRRVRTVGAEAAALPSSRDVLDAARTLLALVEQRQEAARTAGDAVRARDDAQRRAEAAAATTVQTAAELSVPAPAGERRRVREALAAWGRALSLTLVGLQGVAAARRNAADLAVEGVEAADAHRAAEADLAERRGVAEAARATHEVLHRTLGQEAESLLAERAEAEAERREVLAAQKAAGAAAVVAAQRCGAAQDRVDTLTARSDEATAARTEAAARWFAFAETGVLAVALPDLELPASEGAWATDPSVRLARAVEQALDGVDVGEEAFTRWQNLVTSEQRSLDDALAQDGHRASLRVQDEHMVVDVVFRSRPATVPELEAALAEDVEQRTTLLDAREREVIENYLVDEVASSLAELIAAAEAQLARMNAEIESRPTSTGMRLRLRWSPREDGPAGLDAARQRLLRQHADAWSPADRAAVAAFLTGQIRAVRAADPGGSWVEQLAAALDYRSWHRFAVQRRQGGQWRAATGPASGGERVLAASVPLFAAASAHYGSAPQRFAPRLVMLDEAFAGVDDTARADYLGLLAAFDLDVVMTSEREWGCYPQVPGLGIAQLSRSEGIDAVLVTPWRWDGRVRERVQVAPVPTAAASAARQAAVPGASGPATPPGPVQDDLFG